MAVRILHLSDLHLGNDIVLRALMRGRVWWKQADDAVTKGLTDAIRSLSPDYIVISGDFVNKAKSNTFEAAASYLREIFLAAGFDLREKLLVIPGNHDVSFFPEKQPDDFRRLSLYRQFLCRLFDESDVEARRQRFIKIDSDKKIIFVCLDSTLKNSSPIAEGEVGESQQDWIRRKLLQISRQMGAAYGDYAKVAVVHHHCVPIEGTPPSSERFMQLLDAGNVLRTLDEVGINCVLHGHKHVPHVARRMRADSSVMTIVGAGTATCVFLEEQHSWGNNFQMVEITPEKNELTVLMYKADSTGRFLPIGEPKPFSLFRMTPLGYEGSFTKKVVAVNDDGTTKVTVVRAGLRILAPDKAMRSLPLRIFIDVPGAKITNFECDNPETPVEFTVRTDVLIDGNFVLKKPMVYGSQEVTIPFSYTVAGGTAMSKKDLTAMYKDGREKESTVVTVSNPIGMLELELNLPRRFPSVVEPDLEHLGSKIPMNGFECTMNSDKSLNRWTLRFRNPPLNHRISLTWTLPDRWPPE